ncbi:MAG: hypothetical protein M3295_10385 [Chloroflexota bacterium]|nr:hypothetical protein [Chloroflexota bacterium]
MDASEDKQRVRAWARVARAAHAADTRSATPDAPEANRELFDAIAFAATEARLHLREIVDAYVAGTRDRDVSEVWDDVEDYLARIAAVDEAQLNRAFAQAERALPDWPRRLELAIAAHDLAGAARRALGGDTQPLELLRLAVVDVLDGAKAAGATDEELDAFIRRRRIEQCDLDSIIAAAAWIAGERARLSTKRGMTLPGPPWASADEIARDRGVPVDVVSPLIDDGLQRELLTSRTGRGVAVTPAGLDYVVHRARP